MEYILWRGGVMMEGATLRVLGPVRPGDKSSDFRRHGYTCNGDCGAQSKQRDTKDMQFRTQKHGVYFVPSRINKLLGPVNVYIWIGILLCCIHLGAAMNNTTQNPNMTTLGLETTIPTTDLADLTTDLPMITEATGDIDEWIIAVAAVGGVAVIVAIIVIIICCRKGKCRCKCGSSSPPSPVNKDFTPSEDGVDRGSHYNDGYAEDDQGNVAIAMQPVEGIEESIYQNETFIPPPETQFNPAFGYSHSISMEDYPNTPPPAPPTAASNMDTRLPMGIPSPFMPPVLSPGLGPSSPNDIPNRTPPAIPNQGVLGIKAELNDKFKDLPTEPGKAKDKKKKKKKEKDEPKPIQRVIDPNEQIRDEVPLTGPQTSQQFYPNNSRSQVNHPIKFDFSPRGSQPEDDFGGNYEPMSPVEKSPAKSWSPRQPEDGDCGGIYEDVGGDDDEDYGDDYEDVDPSVPQQPRKPFPSPSKLPGQGGYPIISQHPKAQAPVMSGEDDDFGDDYEEVDQIAQKPRKPLPKPFKLPGQSNVPNINYRPMMQPPATSGGEDFGGVYEEMSPNESPKRHFPGRDIDHRPQVPIPNQDDDHGGVYEEMTSPTVSPKKKPPPKAKPKTTKKPLKSPAADDFGQEYGNTGESATLPMSTTHRHPPSFPSSSSLPQTPRGFSREEEDDFDSLPLPPPPPELAQLDHGELYEDVAVEQTNITKKPALVPKPQVAKKPSNPISSSSTLPHISPKPQVSPTKPRSSATLPPVSDIDEPITEEVYMNLPALKGKNSKLYHNLPATEVVPEQISSGGYSFFSKSELSK